MVDFEKAAINALEENFISVITGCFFHLSDAKTYKVLQQWRLLVKSGNTVCLSEIFSYFYSAFWELLHYNNETNNVDFWNKSY